MALSPGFPVFPVCDVNNAGFWVEVAAGADKSPHQRPGHGAAVG